MATDVTGLYVHIPYCKRKCSYCDFCSLPNGDNDVPSGYIDALIAEILSYKRRDKISLSTVYFGGGTPSLLSPDDMDRIVFSIRDAFDLTGVSEFSLEANPGTLTPDKASAYRALGFNRVSMGLQSIHEKEMKILGRIHDFDDFKASFKMLRDAGFENINVDLMYGIPEQTLDSFKATLDTVCAMSPEHISAYGLIVEEGTPLQKNIHTLSLPTQDEECDMYELCCDTLRSRGYSHYEISNYARPGFESRHNLIYWHMDGYIGVGASAHSYFGGCRYSNTENIDEYIYGSKRAVQPSPVTESEKKYEYVMLGMRLGEGISLSDYNSRFGEPFAENKREYLNMLVKNGLAEFTDDRFRLTERGFYLSNSILVEIL